MKEAKDIVDAAPSTVVEGVDKSTAEKLKLELESVGAEVKICSKTQAPTTNASQKKYDVNSIENSEDYARGSVIQAFYKEWRKYTKVQFEALLSKAEEGDAITQYECGYIFAELSRFQLFVKRLDNENSVALEHYSKITDVSKASNLADDWLTKSAEQGFGLAMWDLGEHFATQGSIAQFLDAVRWKDRCKEVNPWRSNFGLYATLWDKIENSKRYTKLYHEYEQLKSEKEKYERLWREKCDITKALEKRYDELLQVRDNLLDKYHALNTEYNKLKDEIQNLKAKKASDSIDVEVTFDSYWGVKKKKTRISKSEYKSLLNGSMKARIAWVNAKFSLASSEREYTNDVCITAL